MSDSGRIATPCEEAIERLKLFVERRPSYPDDAVMMHMDAHDMLRMSHLRALAAFFTRSASEPTWITCPATGKQCNDFCDPGKGDRCAASGESFRSASGANVEAVGFFVQRDGRWVEVEDRVAVDDPTGIILYREAKIHSSDSRVKP